MSLAPLLKAVPMAAVDAEDDAALIARCRAGEQRAWAVLVRRYQRLVHVIVGRMGMDSHAAADVFQTVFARLHQHLPRLSEPQRLRAWIATTAKREGLLMRRRALRVVSLTADGEDGWAMDEPADESPLPGDELMQLQQLDRLRQAIDQLDARSRMLISTLFGDDDAPSYEEVARRLGVPVGSIGPTRARCLAKLRRLME